MATKFLDKLSELRGKPVDWDTACALAVAAMEDLKNEIPKVPNYSIHQDIDLVKMHIDNRIYYLEYLGKT